MSSIPAGHAKPFDSTPHLPAAGLAGGVSEDTTERTLKPEIFNPATTEPTPEHMLKWRKDTEPGKVCLHPGVADDADHQRIEVYGRAEPVGVKVHEVLNTAAKSYLVEQAVAKKESIYLSHKREPLGKPYVRGHTLPEKFAAGDVGFGWPTPQDVAGDQSKHLLHPTERVTPESERQLYVKSHANYDPGEQRHRGYSWVAKDGSIDPSNYRFGGRTEGGDKNGVAKAINPALDESYKRPPIVVDKRLEDFRVVNSEGLGTIKNLGHGAKQLPTNHVYGMPSQVRRLSGLWRLVADHATRVAQRAHMSPRRWRVHVHTRVLVQAPRSPETPDQPPFTRPHPTGPPHPVPTRTRAPPCTAQGGPEWGVRECIGNYTPEEQQPDKDLGRSIRPGWRNMGPSSRIFGVPSIRSDVPAPALKSVADHQNYGDEAGAATLLYPPRFADGGVTQADFLTAASKEEVADIFRCAGFELDDAQVEETYERAKALDSYGRVSVQSFRMALNGEA